MSNVATVTRSVQTVARIGTEITVLHETDTFQYSLSPAMVRTLVTLDQNDRADYHDGRSLAALAMRQLIEILPAGDHWETDHALVWMTPKGWKLAQDLRHKAANVLVAVLDDRPSNKPQPASWRTAK